MKIIKKGILPSKRIAEMECDHCRCVFEAKQEEFQYRHDQRDGEFWCIVCPTEDCHTTLYKYSW